MGILTAEMKAAVDDIRLCFVAAASKDGMPNVSPKGSLTVWDDDHLAFANIASPRTMKNIKENPKMEINTIKFPAVDFDSRGLERYSRGVTFSTMSRMISGIEKGETFQSTRS